jgi:hypothetical protein
MKNTVPVIFTDHACRLCFGRIITIAHPDKPQEQMCYECGEKVVGRVQDLCCCGVKLRNGKNAGLRCEPNPNVTPEVPALIVVRRVDEVHGG